MTVSWTAGLAVLALVFVATFWGTVAMWERIVRALEASGRTPSLERERERGRMLVALNVLDAELGAWIRSRERWPAPPDHVDHPSIEMLRRAHAAVAQGLGRAPIGREPEPATLQDLLDARRLQMLPTDRRRH